MIIHFIDRFRCLVLRLGMQRALIHGHIADVGAVIGLVGNALRQDILRPGDGFFRARDALFFGNVSGSRR